MSSLILTFWRIAMQNLWLTEPSCWLCRISMTWWIAAGPFITMYSTPFSVETITLKSDSKEWHTAYENFAHSINSNRKSFLALVVNKKTSFLISSYTRFFLNSGDIYSALTLSESSTSMIPLMLLSTLACISFCLCSDITASENSSDRSHRPSLARI